MFHASVGGRDAARPRSGRNQYSKYRHALVAFISPLLGPLKTGRGWSECALALCSVLMCWETAPTLAQRLESVLLVLDAALPRRRRVGRTYQGYIKAMSARGAAALETLTAHLRTLSIAAAGKAWSIGGLVPIGADGSRFDAPRTIGNEPLGVGGRDKSGPQMVMLLLVHLGSMLPWAWKIGGACTSERALLRDLLHLLPRNALLVADAGFVGFDLMSGIRAGGLHLLIRVGNNVRLLKDLGYYRREGKNTVYLWPDHLRSRAPLVLRLVRLGSVYLVTDITDPRVLSRRTASELYRRRWGLEVAFRTLKRTLERHKMRSGTAAHSMMELDWTVVGLWVLGLLGVRCIAADGVGPRRLSMALALAAVRHAARARPSQRALRGRLRRAVLDSCKRTTSKKSYRAPRKKDPPSCGAPIIAAASAAQVKRAQELRRRKTAA